MKIGFDLEKCVLGFPEIFGPMLVALHDKGHELFCIANHHVDDWPELVEKLAAVGISGELLDTSLMRTEELTTPAANKMRMIEQCDFAFDDWGYLQQLVTKPIFVVSGRKAAQ